MGWHSGFGSQNIEWGACNLLPLLDSNSRCTSSVQRVVILALANLKQMTIHTKLLSLQKAISRKIPYVLCAPLGPNVYVQYVDNEQSFFQDCVNQTLEWVSVIMFLPCAPQLSVAGHVENSQCCFCIREKACYSSTAIVNMFPESKRNSDRAVQNRSAPGYNGKTMLAPSNPPKF